MVDDADTPKALTLTLDIGQSDTFPWKLELRARDASGGRLLRYRAGGEALPGADEFTIEVLDADRPVWTPMPPSHRKDVRSAMKALLDAAQEAVHAVGTTKTGS